MGKPQPPAAGSPGAWAPPVVVLTAVLVLHFGVLGLPTSNSPSWIKALLLLGLGIGALAYLTVFVSLVRFGRLSSAERDQKKDTPLVRAVYERGGAFFLIIWSGFFNIIIFASAYRVEAILHDGAFSQAMDAVGAVYFSVVTVFTVGYGDIYPVTSATRMTVVVQVCLGFLTLALLGSALTKERA